MSYYPIFLDIAEKRCVVIGGGVVSSRKVKALLEHGAQVTVISPEFCPEMEALLSAGLIIAVSRQYQSGDLEGAFVVVAATNDMGINRQIAAEAQERGILINVVDVPSLCNFIVPSFLRRGDLTVAISTNGRSPALSRKLRTVLEEDFGDEYAILTALVDDVRCELKERGVPTSPELWQKALDLEVLLDLLRLGQRSQARERLLKYLVEV